MPIYYSIRMQLPYYDFSIFIEVDTFSLLKMRSTINIKEVQYNHI